MTTDALAKHKALYRTRDGAADYVFSFEAQEDGRWRVYIDSQPSYQDRPDDLHSTHRERENDRNRIDWCRPIETLSDAKTIAAVWADGTQEYIKAGKRL